MTIEQAWTVFETYVSRRNKGRKLKLYYGLTRQVGFNGQLGQYRAFIGEGEEGAGYGDTPVAAIHAVLERLKH